MKDEAIAHLSDQLMVITTRLQELKRKATITSMTIMYWHCYVFVLLHSNLRKWLCCSITHNRLCLP